MGALKELSGQPRLLLLSRELLASEAFAGTTEAEQVYLVLGLGHMHLVLHDCGGVLQHALGRRAYSEQVQRLIGRLLD